MSIRDNYFDPADIVVAPGMTVEWVNEGANPHSDVADNGLFDSGLSYPGDSYSVTFDGKDTVTYHCSPEITGSVTVAWEERRVRPKREPAEEEGTFEDLWGASWLSRAQIRLMTGLGSLYRGSGLFFF